MFSRYKKIKGDSRFSAAEDRGHDSRGDRYLSHSSHHTQVPVPVTKHGVDYWAMPAFNFADEQGYVPFTQLLDKESVEYAINIVDHAAEPMAGAIVTVRQLLQFVQTFLMQMRVNQAQAQNQ